MDHMGSSINYVMALGEGVKVLFEDGTKTLVLKSVTMVDGVKKCPKLCDVIYG